jgi:cellulose synthase/poly-beta-1,6-N-acetylglucosamine synthase-like glycosyltransferase
MSDPRIRLVMPELRQRPDTSKLPLGRLLVERGLLKPTDLLETLGLQRRSDMRLGDLLLARGLVQERDLFQTLAEQWQVQFLSRANGPSDKTLQIGLDPHSCLTQKLVPWMRLGNATLVATSDPDNFDLASASLPAHLHPVIMAIASETDVEQALCDQSNPLLIHRAETLVPTALSCRALPQQLKTLCAVLLTTLALALILNWITVFGIYVAVFTFAITMVFTGMLLKLSGVALHLLAKAPILTREPALPDQLPRVSILVPLLGETRILPHLIKRLNMINYPKALLDIILVTEEHDDISHKSLSQIDPPKWMRTLIVPAGQITTKPRAMNYALSFCRGSIVGIYDAEDAPDPNQINHVVATFHNASDRTACIQAVLDFYNSRESLLARMFAIEYATWFRLILPGVARLGFAIPLGGTSVFFRKSVLEELHGWDAHNVTEDADLGIRLARAGYNTVLINSVTEEEANDKLWPWIKQRSRWLKGYVVTYLTYMRQPISLLFELGAWKFLGFQAFFLSSISQYMLAPLVWSCMLIFFGAPHVITQIIAPDFIGTVMLTFAGMWAISTAIYILAVIGPKHRHLIPWTITMGPYLLLGTLAIYRGIWQIMSKPFHWDKTDHGHSAEIDNYSGPVSDDTASSFSRVTNATEI